MENKKVVKFLKKGIRVDGKYFPVSYSKGPYVSLPGGTITIYARDYSNIPDFGCGVENNTDMQSDYHEKDRIRILPTHPLYAEVLKMVA